MTKKKLKREVFTAIELAQLFGVNPKTIYRNARTGNLPLVKLGQRLFFPKRAIFTWLKTARFPRPRAKIQSLVTPLPLPFKSFKSTT